jgi:nucleoside-diphosphate-sugar epimerase
MRLLITGATGFIGSHFVKHALAAGHEVVALRRTAESRPRIDLERQPTWLTKSLSDVDGRDLAGTDCLVHLAAVGISPREAPQDELLKWNVMVPARLMIKAAQANVKRWIVSGTFAEYGRAGARYEFIPPDAPLEPTYPYAASKAAGSLLFRKIAAKEKVQLRYLRLFSVFGEGQHESNLWPMIRRAALAGEDLPLTPGEQVRDFIAVEQVAAAMLAAAADDSVDPGAPRASNVGSGRPQTVREFAEHWWRAFGARGKLLFGALQYRDGEVMRFVPQVGQMMTTVRKAS